MEINYAKTKSYTIPLQVFHRTYYPVTQNLISKPSNMVRSAPSWTLIVVILGWISLISCIGYAGNFWWKNKVLQKQSVSASDDTARLTRESEDLTAKLSNANSALEFYTRLEKRFSSQVDAAPMMDQILNLEVLRKSKLLSVGLYDSGEDLQPGEWTLVLVFFYKEGDVDTFKKTISEAVKTVVPIVGTVGGGVLNDMHSVNVRMKIKPPTHGEIPKTQEVAK